MSVHTVAINAASKTYSIKEPPASSKRKCVNANGISSTGGMLFSKSCFHGVAWWWFEISSYSLR